MFVAATLMVIAGAIGVIAYNRPVHAALGLVLTLFGIAVHFVAMEAHFLAAVQVIVYAGAIVVLILFVMMLLGVDRAENLEVEPLPIQRPLAAIVGVAIVALLTAAIFAAERADRCRPVSGSMSKSPNQPAGEPRRSRRMPTSNSSAATCSAIRSSPFSSPACCSSLPWPGLS